MKKKTFNHIISIGLNCEISYQLKEKFGFVESSLLSWAVVNPEKLIDVLKNPHLIFSGDITELVDYNMWRCQMTGMIFHGKKTVAELCDNNGNRDKTKISTERKDTLSRIGYLCDKFVKIAQNNESKLFVLGIHPDFYKLPEADLKTFIRHIADIIKTHMVNASLLVILDKTYSVDMKNIETNKLFIRFINRFAPYDKATDSTLVDLKSGHKIFDEFQPKQIIKSNKVYKFEKQSDFRIDLKPQPYRFKMICSQNAIPIALASDNNCAPQMKTTIVSLLNTANENTIYAFYLMIPADFSVQNRLDILALSNRFPQSFFHFINMRDTFSHIENPAYYHLKLPELLPHLDKIIYLNTDIIVKTDLSELYATDMGNNYVAGVLHMTYVLWNDVNRCRQIGLPDMSQYINSGVLLMNLKQLRQDNIVPKFIQYANKNLPALNQDVINITCYNKIKQLDFAYNVMNKNHHFLTNTNQIPEGFKESFQNPKIIHFADIIKPWQNDDVLFQSEWDAVQSVADTIHPLQKDITQPFVSVIIPFFNAQKYIESTLDSILSQTHTHMEVICVSDGSTDNSIRIIQKYKQADNRVKLIKQRNHGAGIARNTGIKHATGKYLICLDADDLFDPILFSKCVNRLENDSSDICCVPFYGLDDETNTLVWSSPLPIQDLASPTDIKNDLFQQTYSEPWNKMYRTSFVKSLKFGYDNLANFNDLSFSYTAAATAKSISFLKEHLVFYRINQIKQLSNSYKTPDNLFKAVDNLYTNLKRASLFETYKETFYKTLQILIRHGCQQSTDKQAYAHFIISYVNQPHTPDYIKAYITKTNLMERLCKMTNKQKQGFINGQIKPLSFDTEKPIVSVVLSTYNRAEMLKEAIISVLNQTFENFEFIIIDDCSTDYSVRVIKEFAKKDDRIIYIQNDKNKHYNHNLRYGFQIARGKYIARMDDDDICLPERFEKQVRFMDNHPDIAVVGTFIKTFGAVETNGWFSDYESDLTALNTFFHCPLCHPSVMIRKSFLDEHQLTYDKNALYAEDTDMWKNIVILGGKIANIPEILLKYRTHPDSVTKSAQTSGIQNETARHARYQLWRYYFNRKKSDKLSRTLNGNPYEINQKQITDILKEMARQKEKIIPKETIQKMIKKINNHIPADMHVFLASDNRFAQHLAVCMTSVIRNLYETDNVHFYILDGGIKPKNKKRINTLTSSNVSIEFLTVDQSLFTDCKIPPTCSHLTKETFYRYIIPQLKPDLEKSIYLDCDTVIHGSLNALWHTDLGDNYVGAVEELYKDGLKQTKLPLTKMFNAGVLLINNIKWKQDDMTKKLFQNTSKYIDLSAWGDQDILNYTFADKIKWLDPVYNVQQNAFFDGQHSLYTDEQMWYACHKPIIIHFNGSIKPWQDIKKCRHPYARYYFKYLTRSPFKQKHVMNKIKSKIKLASDWIYSKSQNTDYKKYTILGIKHKKIKPITISHFQSQIDKLTNQLVAYDKQLAEYKHQMTRLTKQSEPEVNACQIICADKREFERVNLFLRKYRQKETQKQLDKKGKKNDTPTLL